jgi:hypothetical protein
VISAQPVQMAAGETMEYAMPPLSNNCTPTEERCFLSGPCRDVISKTISEEVVSEELVIE